MNGVFWMSQTMMDVPLALLKWAPRETEFHSVLHLQREGGIGSHVDPAAISLCGLGTGLQGFGGAERARLEQQDRAAGQCDGRRNAAAHEQ